MAIGSGQVSLKDIEDEYGGSAPTALSEYYGDGNAPGSGEIQIHADFQGTSDFDPGAHTFSRTSSGSWSYSIPDGATTMKVEMCGGGGGGGGPQNVDGGVGGQTGGTSTGTSSGFSISSAGGGGGGTNGGGPRQTGAHCGPAGPTGGTNPPFNGNPGKGGCGCGNPNWQRDAGGYGSSGSFTTVTANLPGGTSRSISGSVGGGGVNHCTVRDGCRGGTGGVSGAVHVSFTA
jgi:hypothetical protein